MQQNTEQPKKKKKNPGNPLLWQAARDAGTQWKKGESANPGGMPKGSYQEFAEAFGLQMGKRIHKSFKFKLIEHLLDMTEFELEKIQSSRITPMFLASIAKALIQDKKKGHISTLNSVFDRVFGKAGQSISIEDKTQLEDNVTLHTLYEVDTESLLSFISSTAVMAEIVNIDDENEM